MSCSLTSVNLRLAWVLLAVVSTVSCGGTAQSTQEARGIALLLTVIQAQNAFSATCGHGNYSPDLTNLVKAASGAQAYLPNNWSIDSPDHDGYRVTLHAGLRGEAGQSDCMGRPTTTKYFVSAVPIAPGRTFPSSFAANQEGEIWSQAGPVAPSEPFSKPATRIR